MDGPGTEPIASGQTRDTTKNFGQTRDTIKSSNQGQEHTRSFWTDQGAETKTSGRIRDRTIVSAGKQAKLSTDRERTTASGSGSGPQPKRLDRSQTEPKH